MSKLTRWNWIPFPGFMSGKFISASHLCKSTWQTPIRHCYPSSPVKKPFTSGVKFVFRCVLCNQTPIWDRQLSATLECHVEIQRLPNKHPDGFLVPHFMMWKHTCWIHTYKLMLACRQFKKKHYSFLLLVVHQNGLCNIQRHTNYVCLGQQGILLFFGYYWL